MSELVPMLAGLITVAAVSMALATPPGVGEGPRGRSLVPLWGVMLIASCVGSVGCWAAAVLWDGGGAPWGVALVASIGCLVSFVFGFVAFALSGRSGRRVRAFVLLAWFGLGLFNGVAIYGVREGWWEALR